MRRRLALGNGLTRKPTSVAEDWRARGNIRRLWAARQDRCGPAPMRTMARLARSAEATSSSTRYAALRPATSRPRFQRRRAARHGRLEPRPGSAGDDVRPEARLAAAAHSRFAPIRHRSRRSKTSSISPKRCSSSRASRVDTLEPKFFKDYFFKRVTDTVGAEQGRQAFHRHHRSRLVAGEGGAKQQGSGTSSTASPASAAAIRCCRRSAWCRRRHAGIDVARLAGSRA